MQSKGAAESEIYDWESLATASDEVFYHGAVFRLQKSVYPHETPVDLLLIDDEGSPSSYTLLVSTGYKAGLPLRCVPAEALAHGGSGIDRSWLVKNGRKWVYPECPPKHVLVLRNYPPGVGSTLENSPSTSARRRKRGNARRSDGDDK